MKTNPSTEKNEQQNNPLAASNPTDRDFQHTANSGTNEPNTGENADTAGEDTDPVLTEKDLEDNNLTVEEGDQVEWDAPKESGQNSDTANASE